MATTDAQDVFKPRNQFEATDTLEGPLQNFVRLQQEISGQNVGLMASVNAPNVGEEAYTLPWIMTPKKIKTQNAARDRNDRILEDIQNFFNVIFKQVVAQISANFQYLNLMEDAVDFEIQRLEDKDPKAVEKLKTIKSDITAAKETTKAQQQTVQDMDENPQSYSPEDFENIEDDVRNQTSRIRDIFDTFYNDMKNGWKKTWNRNTSTAWDAYEKNHAGDRRAGPENNFNDMFSEEEAEQEMPPPRP